MYSRFEAVGSGADADLEALSEAACCNPPNRHSGPNSPGSMAVVGAVGVDHQGRRRTLVASASAWREALPRLLNLI